MKKNKRIIIIISIVLIVALLIAGYIVMRNRTIDNIMDDIYKVENLKETKINVPEFEVGIRGLFNGSITDETIKDKDIKVYEFDTVTYDSFYFVENHYVGVKLLDVLKAMDIKEYSQIEFNSENRIFIEYDKTEINDSTFLVFYRDGKPIRSSDKVTLLAADLKYSYSVEDLDYMYFNDRVVNAGI